jgi:signal transduction histidine kinase
MSRAILKVLPFLVIVLGIGLLAGVVGLYARTERTVIERHNRHQLLMVEAVGSALGKEIDRRLGIFNVAGGQLRPGQRGIPANLRELMQAAGFQQITVHPSSPSLLPGLTTGQVILGDQGLLLPVSVVTPAGLTVEGQLPFSALSPLIESWNRRVGGRLWLLDDEGRLIYSQLHPDMLSRSALGGDPHCLNCHQDFAMEASMVAGQAAAVQHRVANRPQMLVCYAPVEFGTRRWSLAMSDPQAEVIAVTRRSFLQASLLTALFLVLVVGTVLGLLRTYQQKMDAERRVAVAENRARLEARMMRAEQLAAIGKMTAQIAHEINTPLSSISLNVIYLLSELASKLGELPGGVSQAAQEIEREVERLKTFTGECLKLTRIHSPQFRTVSLTDVVRGFVSFISREAKRRNVHLEAAFESEAVRVRGDGDLLRQVLLNLARNAFDAMPSGGRLEITLFRRDNFAELSVSDTGPGVPEQRCEKVFDAFYTTKPEGTGLGLAVVRRIVEQHGGQALCGQGVSGGARFLIRIPLAPPADSDNEEEAAEEAKPAARSAQTEVSSNV